MYTELVYNAAHLDLIFRNMRVGVRLSGKATGRKDWSLGILDRWKHKVRDRFYLVGGAA